MISALAGCMINSATEKERQQSHLNVLILMSDNHSWNHLGSYHDPVVKTPNIDRLADRGIKFTNAFCDAPSCTPARAAMLTGQHIWRLEEGANLWGTLPSKYPVYPEMLENAGYFVGHQGKGWGPGNYEAGGRDRNPAGDKYESFREFLSKRKKGQPFNYWFSSQNPHRPYDQNAEKAGINPDSVRVPPYLPDNDIVRRDIADYYAEVEDFDKEVGSFLGILEEMGEIENTIIIVCSDNGWQMPRGLANLYEFGTKIPMIISTPESSAGRVVSDFISLNDLAPTFLELANIPIPEEMTAKSLAPIIQSKKNLKIDPERDFMVTARERHAFVREGGAGYGGRSIITDDFLYIRNYEPEQWPAGDPPLYGDVDAHMLHYPSPTKMFLLENRQKRAVKELFDLAFEKRPTEELYDLSKDPYQMKNVANLPIYYETQKRLSDKLYQYLLATEDPRVVGGEMKWIESEYFFPSDKKPTPSKSAQEKLNLKEIYIYLDEE